MNTLKRSAAWSTGILVCVAAVLACGESAEPVVNTAGSGGSTGLTAGNGGGGSAGLTAGTANGVSGSSGAGGSAGQAAGNGGAAGGAVGGTVTYWQDIVPIAQAHCMECHQEGGLGPDLISTYAAAEAAAGAIRIAVETAVMPPWDALSDGSCGTFMGAKTLSAQEIATISAWVDGGKLEGTPGQIQLPAQPTLDGATDYSTPAFTPMPEGTILAQNDEYRCFIVDTPLAAAKFVTGYDVQPGVPAMIHHVLGFLVDPAADSGVAGMTNEEQMQALDDESPDRLGWPCFGMAGDGVAVKAVPITWAPGQGVVTYPGESGVPFAPTDRFVVQMHYNMENANLIGTEDTTLIRLRLVDTVQRIGVFVLNDPLLASLSLGNPETLAPGQDSVLYNWQATASALGLAGLTGVQLNGVMPHMHKLGNTYNMSFSDGATQQCGIQIVDWDIHWQRMYFYQDAIPVTATTNFDVTCDYDTSDETTPVLPGWGTSNEMCLATLYFTADAP